MKTLALKSDGSIVAWGADYYGVDELIPPAGNDFVAISAGYFYSLALKSNGTIVGWGGDWWGQVSDIPEGNDFVAISAGEAHGLAMKSDGTIVVWGNNDAQQLRTPTIMVFERYSYDAFGETTIRGHNGELRTTSAFGNRYMFTGREYDSETGNYYYRARYYSPKIGRFLQPDSIMHRGGANLYSYCRNNSMRWRDPRGLTIVPVIPGDPDIGPPPTVVPPIVGPEPIAPIPFPPTPWPLPDEQLTPYPFSMPGSSPIVVVTYNEIADIRRNIIQSNPSLNYIDTMPYAPYMDELMNIERYTDLLTDSRFGWLVAEKEVELWTRDGTMLLDLLINSAIPVEVGVPGFPFEQVEQEDYTKECGQL